MKKTTTARNVFPVQLDDFGAKFEEWFRSHPPRPMAANRRQLIVGLRSRIDAQMASGRSIDEFVQALEANGIKVSTSTVKSARRAVAV